MTEPGIEFDSAAASRQIANFTIGFCKLNRHSGREDAAPAGSGTLVRVGMVSGILTAAHVLKQLPDEGDVGIVLFRNQPEVLQKQTIDMELTEKLIISAGSGPTGPDLGFLRLPPSNVSNLQATTSFLNIGERSRAVRAPEQPTPPYFDAVVGVVGEWTRDLPPSQPAALRKEFTLLFGSGNVVAKYTIGGFDFCNFEVSFQALEPPASYGGVSGGGLWRIYIDTNEGVRDSVRETRLLGVAFYQFEVRDGKLLITCHGPRSVYDHLITAMLERWPECTAV